MQSLLTDGGFIVGLIGLAIAGLIGWGKLNNRQEFLEKECAQCKENVSAGIIKNSEEIKRHHEDRTVHRIPEWEEQRWTDLGARLDRIERRLESLTPGLVLSTKGDK